MIFGRIDVERAEGAILAHTTRLPGAVLRKGALLTAPDIARLLAAGHRHITAAVLEDGDVTEDQAAARLANALVRPGIVSTRPGNGRANLVAERTGLFRAQASGIDAMNSLHEAITVATLPDATRVAAGTLLATIKIIPFSVPGAALAQAEQLARAAPPLALPAFRNLRVGLILTELPGLKASIQAGTLAVTQQRVRALGGTLLPPLHVPHAEAEISEALQDLLRQGAELLLIATASACVDRGDVGPAAILRAGGTVDHFGMPVDPGNLICLAHVGTVSALVLPGCARSPALNGIDLVLALLFAGEPAGRAEITRMGVGGLLVNPLRLPPAGGGRCPPAPPTGVPPASLALRGTELVPRSASDAGGTPVGVQGAKPPVAEGNAEVSKPRVAGLILAAGLSSRMAPDNKLLLPDSAGTPMVARVTDALLTSRADPIVVVLGHQADQVGAALASRAVRTVVAADYKDGMSASLRAGLAALPMDAAAVLICLADMPLVDAAILQRLLDAYDAEAGRRILVPTYQGKRGNPVLWDRSFFAEMAALTGDTGARALLLRHAAQVTEIEMETDAVLRDFDGPKKEGVLF